MERFEYHIKELIKLAKRLFSYCLYLVIFFVILMVVFIILDFHKTSTGWFLFVLLLIIVFFIEFVYGLRLYKKFNWVLTNYQIDPKEKCLEMLTIRNLKTDISGVDPDKENIPFPIKFSIHLKHAVNLLKQKE